MADAIWAAIRMEDGGTPSLTIRASQEFRNHELSTDKEEVRGTATFTLDEVEVPADLQVALQALFDEHRPTLVRGATIAALRAEAQTAAQG